MKRYPKYKDSGIKWIGNIPQHWEVKRLASVSYEHYISNKEVHHQNLLSLSYGRIIRKDINKTDGLLPSSFDTYQIVEEGNIVLRLTDLQNDHRSLRVGIVKEEGIITSAYLTLGVRDNIIPQYLYYQLHSNDIHKVFYGMGDGIRQGLNWNGMRKLPMVLPPIEEQQAIVAYLDEKVGKIDRYISEKEKEIVALDELKQASIANAVTRGLDPNAPLKDSGIKWIGNIPQHWEVKQMRNYLTLVSEKNHPEKQLLSVTREQGVIIRNTESKEENHNYIPDDLSGYKYVKEGQFVINKMKSWQGSYGVSDYEGIVSPAYYVCDLSFPCKEFFSKAVRSKAYIPFFTQYSKGIRVDQWDLSTIGLKTIPFIEPPIEEQQAIVDYINTKTAKIDQMKDGIKSEIEKLNEYKQRLISDVVTGKVCVEGENKYHTWLS